MIVVVASECEKKAFKKSKRILSKYMTQVGRRSWMDFLSQENLDAMKHELNQSRSIHTSISCHKIVNRKRTTLLWQVGNKDAFSEDGEYAFSTLREHVKLDIDNSDLLELMKRVTFLAALFHDLGKGTKGFSAKLESSISNEKTKQKKKAFSEIKSDPFRHELISLFMLGGLTKDEDFFEKLSEPSKVSEFFSASAPEILKGVHDSVLEGIKNSKGTADIVAKSRRGIVNNEYIKTPLMAGQWRASPILTSVKWLVVTHHKTTKACKLDNLGPGESLTPNLHQLINFFSIKEDTVKRGKTPLDQLKVRIKDFLTLSSSAQPWQDEEWTTMVADTVSEIKGLMTKFDPKNEKLTAEMPMQSRWVDSLLLMGRSTLIYADHIESKGSDPTFEKEDVVYANTREEKGGVVFGDSLPKHLKRVAKKSKEIFTGLNEYKTHPLKDLPCLMDIPSSLLKYGFDGPKRFHWQSHIARGLKSWVTENPEVKEAPFFGYLNSRTGSGKTRSAPAILAELSDHLRFTLGLGRVTLTTQSYQAYKEPAIGFEGKDLTILIGEAPPWVSGDITDSDNVEDLGDSKDSAMGTDTLDDSESDHIFSSDLSERQFDTEIAQTYSKSKERALLSNPISVMTIDHLVAATYGLKSSNVKLHYHIQGSDLILDEIDDYSELDFVVLCKLIYLYGFYKRKVIVASATVSEVQVSAMYDAFCEGVKVSDFMYGKETPVNSGVFNDLEPYIECFLNPRDRFAEKYRTFTHKVIQSYQSEAKTHLIKEIDIAEEEADFHESLFESCLLMHRNNATAKLDGVNVSIGFVRFNNVSLAQKFAIYLNDSEMPGSSHKAACYHSKMLMFDRFRIESLLDRMLNRKEIKADTLGGSTDPLCTHPEIVQAVKEAKAKGNKDLVIIVSTTSIQETGRDNDYDWAIVEPLSARSLIQSAGRVNRHRQMVLREGQKNVGILNKPYKSYDDANTRRFSYPGVETPNGSKSIEDRWKLNKTPSPFVSDLLRENNIDVSDEGQDYMGTARGILNEQFFSGGIDASPCLVSPCSYSSHPVEAMTIARILNLTSNKEATRNPVKHKNALNAYIRRSDVKVSNSHGSDNRFRDDEGNKMVEYVASPDRLGYSKNWIMRIGNNQFISYEIPQRDFDAKNMLLGEVDLLEEIEGFCKKYEIKSASKEVDKVLTMRGKDYRKSADKKQKQTYHPLLGVMSEPYS